MNLIQKEIRENKRKIKEREVELAQWEDYNKCKNDLMRHDIAFLKSINKGLVRKAKKLNIRIK